MKKRGFTLVELLAVIVILAIIALIATPIILGVIETSKKGASENSAIGYIDAVEKQIAINLLDEEETNDIKDRVYSVEELKDLGVTVKGTAPSNGTVEIKNGEVKDYVLGIDKYVVENGKAVKVSNTNKYTNGTVVYYNPTTGEKCEESGSVSTTGTKSGCMKWYIFNDSEGASLVNLILDHNTTAKVAYNSTKSNSEMKEVKTALENDTKNWEVPARLITANEVAEITGNTNFSLKSNLATFFDTNTAYASKTCQEGNTSGCKYGWLYDRTYISCKNYGCLNNSGTTQTQGYWTSTAYKGDLERVFLVYFHGYIHITPANDPGGYGIRPVITVEKSRI